MNAPLSPIIHAYELRQLLPSKHIILVDAGNGKDAKSNYEAKHLEGAVFLDLNTQLAHIQEDLSIGGRHPLPDITDFANTLASIGIASESHVVIYDDKQGANAAARFWWMLKSVGHEKVQVLNGGIQEAEKHGLPISSKTEIPDATDVYQINRWKLHTAPMDEVENMSQSKDHLVIDVRDAARYGGLTEPIDLIAGHIPGAINVPFTENLDDDGLFLSPDVLKIKYQTIFSNLEIENISVHCGSGVTACHTLLAIAYAELELPKLYVGSWSEWSRNNKPIATTPEKT